jgi:hypothetical protein
MNADRFIIGRNVLAAIRKLNRVRFMTLTLKHSTSPLRGQIDHLYASFRRLRRSRWFKDHVRGGVWFFQIKWIDDSQSWHPHLHILFDGRYTPQQELKTRWRKASQGSYVVDIRGVKNNAKAADYVARYATEPGDISGLEGEKAVEVMEALRGRQIKGKWGTLAHIVLKPQASEDATEWDRLGPFGNIMFHKSDNQLYADIVSSWINRTPCIIHPSMLRLGVPPPWPDRIDEPETYRQLLLWPRP